MRVQFVLVAALVVCGFARADYMSISCDPAVTEESTPDNPAYSFGKSDRWAQDVDGKAVPLKNVIDWKSGDDVKGLIATEKPKRTGYRQFFYNCKGSCWSAEMATLNVYEVGTGEGRVKIDGPVKCSVSVD